MEKFWIWLSWRLPKSLVYWCYIRMASHATLTKYKNREPNEVGIMDVMNCWN
jgi:hypothetical protein